MSGKPTERKKHAVERDPRVVFVREENGVPLYRVKGHTGLWADPALAKQLRGDADALDVVEVVESQIIARRRSKRAPLVP